VVGNMAPIVKNNINTAYFGNDFMQKVCIILRTYAHFPSFPIKLGASWIDVDSKDNGFWPKVFSPELQ
jgi:hypothetical protein